MTDINTILQAIDTLPENDLDAVRQRIDQRLHNPMHHIQPHDVEDWITNLHMAVDNFREGLLETELQDIVNSMNMGYLSPKELHDLQAFADWADDEA